MRPGMQMSLGAECGLSPEATVPLPLIHLSIFSNSRLLREGLGSFLALEDSLQLVGTYDGGQLDIDVLPNPQDHLILVDATLGRQRLAGLTWAWRARLPAPAVLALDLDHDVELILDCIEWGVSGYTVLGEGFGEVLATIRETFHGRARCSPEVTARLFERLARQAHGAAPYDPEQTPLTPREREILGYIARNCSNREIAEALVIELRTVKNHVHNILNKLKLSHRWDAARVAAERGWLSDRAPH